MKRRTQAFTLVELLVVIGIIALLISILLPALNKARQTATTLSCLSQLRQFGQIGEMYTTDNKGFIFPSQWQGDQTSSPTKPPYGLQQILGDYIKLSVADQNGNSSGMLQKIWVCPAVIVENVQQFPQTYAVNRGVHPDQQGSPFSPSTMWMWIDLQNNRYNVPRKIGQIHRASEIVSMADGTLLPATGTTGGWLYGTEVNNGNMTNRALAADSAPKDLGWINNDLTPTYGMRFRHNRNTAGNVVFVDGHAETFHLKKDGITSDLLIRNFTTIY